MKFATNAQSLRSQRTIAILTAISVLMSLMVIYASPAQAHHPEIEAELQCDPASVVAWTATSWATGAQGTHSNIVIEVQTNGGGGWTEVGSGEFNAGNGYTFAGSFDSSPHEGDSVVVRARAVGPWSNGQGGGETRSASAIQVVDECEQVSSVSIGLTQECTMTADEGPKGIVSFDVTDPDSAVESIFIDGPGDFTASVSSGDGWQIVLLPGDYEWSVVYAEGSTGPDLSGEFTVGDDCLSCPIPGAIDLTPLGQLGSFDSPFFDPWRGPLAIETIPAGFYNITLASYDSHSEKDGQAQLLEIWALSSENFGGGWVSPFTPDLSESTNFEVYTNVGGGPVFVPELTELYGVHGYIGDDMSANSVAPVCAKFDPVVQEVDVEVTATSCLVDEQGQPVGDINITIDPDAAATVNVYSDAAKTDLVGTTESDGTIEDLAPGTYYWEAIPADGYELTGSAEGSVVIEDCDVTVQVGALCILDEDAGVGQIAVEISTPGAATVVIKNAADEVVDTLTQSGTVEVPEGATYTWEATASDGFALSGDTSGVLDIEECTRSIEVEVGGICEEDIPVLFWQVTPVNFDADEVTITWNDINPGDELYSSVEALSGSMVWPGAVIEDGVVVDWPGWIFVDNKWEQGSDGYENTRPTASVSFTVNPTVTLDVEYPGGEPTCDGPPGEIIVEKIVQGDGDKELEFTFETVGFNLADNTLAHGESSSSGDLLPGDGYAVSEVVPDGWSLIDASCDDGSPIDAIDLEVGETITCTFTNFEDEVSPSIVVSVDAVCDPDDDTQAIITATIPVADGATVVVRDSNDQVIATFTETGSVVVSDDAVYSWEATPGDGFEFAPGSESSGTLSVQDCVDELPFTGIDSDLLALLSIGLLGAGALLVLLTRQVATDGRGRHQRES